TKEPQYPREVPGVPHVQSRRCMNAAYGDFERCASSKKTDTCRFINFRIFGTKKDPETETDVLVYGPKFQSVTIPEPDNNYDFKETTDEQRGYILDMIAPTFRKILKKELAHFEYANLRKLPNRAICQLCDSCDTTIFSGYWMCCVCGKEFCLSCYDEWDVSKKSRTIVCSFRRSHNKEQMVPIYHYNKDLIQRIINETEQRMIDNGDSMDIDEFSDNELPDELPISEPHQMPEDNISGTQPNSELPDELPISEPHQMPEDNIS
ncbi:2050_t:CDS:2, partial [Racocetra persica]